MNIPPRLSLGSYRNSLIWKCGFWTGFCLGKLDMSQWLPPDERKYVMEGIRNAARNARDYREELTDG